MNIVPLKYKVLRIIFDAILFTFVSLCILEQAHGQATDTYIGACAAQPACILQSNVSWANGNQVWRFTAYSQSESIRVWILNRNPTNAHTSQTIQVWTTDDASVPSLLNNADRWVQDCIVNNTVTGAQLTNVSANNPTAAPGANGKGTGYTVGMFATQVAVRMTGAAAQAGSPDTFDIGVVQQPSTYPGGPQPGCDSSTVSNSAITSPVLGPTVGIIVPGLAYGNFGVSSTINQESEVSLTNSAPAAQGAVTVQFGAAIEEKGPRWAITSNPAAGNQATASRAAVAATRHIADCVSFSSGSVAAPALTALTVNLRDGATGAGTIIATWEIIISASTGQNTPPLSICGLNLGGTTNTAMTLEFSASLANLIESVSLSGYDAQ